MVFLLNFRERLRNLRDKNKNYVIKYLNGFSDSVGVDFFKNYNGEKHTLHNIHFRLSFLLELKKNQSINSVLRHIDDERFYKRQIPNYEQLKELIEQNNGLLKVNSLVSRGTVQRSEVCLPSTNYLRKVLHFPFLHLSYGFVVTFPEDLAIYHIFEFVITLQEFYCQNLTNHQYIFVEKLNKNFFRLFFVVLGQPHPYKLLPLEHICEVNFNFLIYVSDWNFFLSFLLENNFNKMLSSEIKSLFIGEEKNLLILLGLPDCANFFGGFKRRPRLYLTPKRPYWVLNDKKVASTDIIGKLVRENFDTIGLKKKKSRQYERERWFPKFDKKSMK